MKDTPRGFDGSFSSLIAKRRKEFRLTQTEVSKRAGLSNATLSLYETGSLDPKSMRVGTLISLGRALDLSPSLLISLIEGTMLISKM
mgnify:FL=1